MKRLSILRHAKSGWDDPVARDFDRPVNERGSRAATLIGHYAAGEALSVDHIVASPAARVIDTLDSFLPAAGLSAVEPHWDRRIYLASSATLLDVLREQPAEAGHLLIVGHNPGLEDLLIELVPDDGTPLRIAAGLKFPTAALATVELAITDWSAIANGCGTLVGFCRPRDLDPALGPDAD